MKSGIALAVCLAAVYIATIGAQQSAVTGRTDAPQQVSPNTAVFSVDHSAFTRYGLDLSADAIRTGSAGATFVDYGTYKLQLSERTASGGAEVHAHWDDVMMVQAGSATLITGGTVVDGKTGADGETRGLRIEGGRSQALAPGDMVTVRAGTPHQILVPSKTIYRALVIKIHEP